MTTVVVLAGGQSRRMGQDKAALVIDDGSSQMMIERVIQCLQPVADDIVVVGGGWEHRLVGVRWVADAFPGEGPVGGLITGLRTVVGDRSRCLVTTCDLPFLQGDVLAALVSDASGADVVGLSTSAPGGPGIEPFPAVYHRRCLPMALDHFQSGGRSMRGMLQRLSWVAIPDAVIAIYDPERWTLFNVNTPAELAAARAYSRRNRASADARSCEAGGR